jgi:hypothetical protein
LDRLVGVAVTNEARARIVSCSDLNLPDVWTGRAAMAAVCRRLRHGTSPCMLEKVHHAFTKDRVMMGQ